MSYIVAFFRHPLFIVLALFLLLAQCADKEEEDTTEPGVPYDISFSHPSDTVVVVRWKVRNVQSIDVFRFDELIGTVTESDMKSDSTYEFNDNGFEYGISIDYKLIAKRNNGSETVAHESFRPEFPAPSNLFIENQSLTGLLIKWQDNSAFETGFQIEKLGGSGEYSVVGGTPPNATEFLWNGELKIDTMYVFRVQARGHKNHSRAETRPFLASLSAPENMQALFPTDQYVQLIWNDRASVETGYELQTNYNGLWSSPILLPANSLDYKIERPFSIDTTYSFRVRAVSGSTSSSYSEANGKPELAGINDFTASNASESSIQLNWEYSSASYHSGFIVEYRIKDTGSFQEFTSVLNTARSAVITGLDSTKEFEFRIVVESLYNQSAPSPSKVLKYGLNTFVARVTISNPTLGSLLKIEHLNELDETWITGTSSLGIFGDNLSNKKTLNFSDNFQVGRLAHYGRIFHDSGSNTVYLAGNLPNGNFNRPLIKKVNLSTYEMSNFVGPLAEGLSTEALDVVASETDDYLVYSVNTDKVYFQRPNRSISNQFEFRKTFMYVDMRANPFLLAYTLENQVKLINDTWTGPTLQGPPIPRHLSYTTTKDTLVAMGTNGNLDAGYIYVYKTDVNPPQVAYNETLPYNYITGRVVPNSSKAIILGSQNRVYLYDFKTATVDWVQTITEVPNIRDVDMNFSKGKFYVISQNMIGEYEGQAEWSLEN